MLNRAVFIGVFIICLFVVPARAEISEQSLYEKIYSSFIGEDYQTSLRLSQSYLTHQEKGPRYEDIQYLEAMSLNKLGRTVEGDKKFRALESR